MTREEALSAWKQLRNEIEGENHLFVGTINPEMVDLAIAALERDRWISVEERLPEPGSIVLCRFKNGKFAVCFWGNWKWQDIYNYSEYLDITHWMPLPEPPKEKL